MKFKQKKAKMHLPPQGISFGIPSGNREAMKEIINHTVMSKYLQHKKLQEDSQVKVKNRIFKEALPTKSFGYRLKALESFKKAYEEQYQKNRKMSQSPVKKEVDPKSLWSETGSK
jgi:hypothetical protein